MARKNPLKWVPLEERPDFLALVAGLANVPVEQFPGAAMQCAEKYHDAVLAGHVEVLDQMEAAYKALVYKLNGDTMFGCGAEEGSAANVLAHAVAAKPGQVPRWGAAGEFLLEVEGLRVRVVVLSNMLGNHLTCELHAVDLDRPFISTTGYRSAGLTVVSSLGETVDQAARCLVLDLLQNEGRLKPIAADAGVRVRPQKVPVWLADALAGVRPDGQLAMFGDAPQDPEAKVALSNAARQKAFRTRQREKRAALKAEGLHTVQLSSTDLARLFIALDVHLTFNHLLDWDLQEYRELATRLFKGDARGAAMVQALGTSEGVAVLQKRRDQDAKRGWEAYNVERKQNAGMGQKLLQAQEEIKRLQATLQQIAAEVGADPSAPAAQPVPVANVDRVEELQRRVKDLEKWNAQEVADRALAFDAVEVLQARLKKSGLVHDYRRQPGE